MTRPDPPTHPRAAALPGCATLLRGFGLEPAGTATPMRSWLLIEQPGPWPVDVLERVLRAALPAGATSIWKACGRAGAAAAADPLLRSGRAGCRPDGPDRRLSGGPAGRGGTGSYALTSTSANGVECWQRLSC